MLQTSLSQRKQLELLIKGYNYAHITYMYCNGTRYTPI